MSLERKSNHPVHPMPHRNSQLQNPSLDCSRALKIDIRYLPVALLHEEHALLGSEGARQKIGVQDLVPTQQMYSPGFIPNPRGQTLVIFSMFKKEKKYHNSYIHHRVRYL